MTELKGFALLSCSPYVTDGDLELIRDASKIRLAALVEDWLPVMPGLIVPDVKCISSLKELTDDYACMAAVRSINIPEDLAYHTKQGDVIYGLILADVYQTKASVQKAFGHEEDEAWIDRDCDSYGPFDEALEVEDPTQNDDAPVTLPSGASVAFAPYVTPAWFGMGTIRAGTPTNNAGLQLARGATRPGGYKQMRNGSQVQGMGYTRPAHKTWVHSREYKRETKRVQRYQSCR